MLTPPPFIEADVQLAAAGDRSAYERLVRRCSGLVTAVALSVVRDVGRSEDIAQEVFVAAWKDLKKLRNPRTFLPWLRNMTRHLSLRTLRDRHVPTEGTTLEGYADERASVADRLERAERDRVLEEALMELEADDREVLLVYYREGQSLRQVASLLELSEPAARKRLSRARARLRTGVEERLGELAVRTAPDSKLAANVMALLPASLATSASAATALKAATSVGGTLAQFIPAILALLVGLGGISFSVSYSVKKLQAKARDEEERQGIRRYGIVSGAMACIAIIGMSVGTAFDFPLPFFLVIWASYIGVWDYLALVYVPRVSARRLALERAEDPAAEARQRRERLISYAMIAYVSLCAWGSIAIMLRATLLR
jgi:RNA polymerase sigma factor (sigma-70 family)